MTNPETFKYANLFIKEFVEFTVKGPLLVKVLGGSISVINDWVTFDLEALMKLIN